MPVEISLYRDGLLCSVVYFHTCMPAQGNVELFRIPTLTGDPRDELNLEIMWDGSPMLGWWAFRASLFDGTRRPMVPAARPGLLYDDATDCPSVTVMQSIDPGGGVYALCLRAGRRYEPPVRVSMPDRSGT